jgi:ADP-ribose pyrophosphatase YjhB (NUDIX family)
MALKEWNVQYAGPLGNQLQAAGALIFAADTGNFLVVYRSPGVVDPNLWCGVGGKIEQGETPEQASRREIAEEVGYKGELVQTPIFTWDEPKLKFFNFLGVVPKQFTPILNWETAGYVWCTLDKIPQPMHYGLRAVLTDKNSQTKISSLETADSNRFSGFQLHDQKAKTQAKTKTRSKVKSSLTSLDVFTNSSIPRYHVRATWLEQKITPLLAKYKLVLDTVISNEGSLLFSRKQAPEDLELSLVKDLEDIFKVRFMANPPNPTIIYTNISRKITVGSDYLYFVVKRYSSGTLTFNIVF